MLGNQLPLQSIDRAIRDVYFAINENESRRMHWTSMTEDALWRELVACILGSRVRYETAALALERLDASQLLGQIRRSSRYDQYELDVQNALMGGEPPDAADHLPLRYPFYRSRAAQVRGAAERLFGSGGSIRGFLDCLDSSQAARRRLAAEVPGLGPKQASLFLRNIGHATHIAVLDTHVLKYMYWTGLTEVAVKSISNIRHYESLEDKFNEHSISSGYVPDQFDLAVWVVVRTAMQEDLTWA